MLFVKCDHICNIKQNIVLCVLIDTFCVDFMIHYVYNIIEVKDMEQHYNQNYTKDEIKAILDKIKKCVSLGRYIISQNDNRQENINFINEYNIRKDKQKSILMQIKAEDFCHSLQNTNPGYEYEVLYVFAPQVELFNADGKPETVDIYTKFNLIDKSAGSRVVVISFHKLNRPIHYLFRD